MIDWNNFEKSRQEDEEERKRVAGTEVIDWDNFGNSKNMSNSTEIIDWDNFSSNNLEEDKFLKNNGFITDQKTIKNNINNLLSENKKKVATQKTNTTKIDTENEKRKPTIVNEEEEEESNNANLSQQKATTEAIGRSQAREQKEIIKQNKKQSEIIQNDINENPGVKVVTDAKSNVSNSTGKVQELNNNFVAYDGALIDTKNDVVVTKNRESEKALNTTFDDKYAEYKLNKNAIETAKSLDEEAEKGGWNTASAFLKNVGLNIAGGFSQSVFGTLNLLNAVPINATKKLHDVMQVVGNEEVANRLNNKYHELIDEGAKLNVAGNYISTINNKINNDFIRTSGDVSSVISRQVMDFAMGGSLGVEGAKVQAFGVAGSSFQETLNENPDNLEQANLTAALKGTAAYVFEKMFDANLLTRGSGSSSIEKQIVKNISKYIKSKSGKEVANFTVGVVGENVEEILEDNTGYLIDALVNNKELPSFEQWWANTTETIKTTTISTIIMNLLGFGGTSFTNKENELSTDQEFWLYETQKIIDKNNLSVIWDTNSVLNLSGAGVFYSTTFNGDGNVESVNPVAGKIINNPNPNVDIEPVVIYNKENKTYNIIDNNTGLMLDSTPYKKIEIAENEFYSKMTNLDNASINNINNKVAQANIAINNKVNEVVSQAENEMNADRSIQNAQKNVENNTQTPSKNVIETPENGTNNVNVNTNAVENTNNAYTNVDTNTIENANNPDTNTSMQNNTYTNTTQTLQNEFTDDLSNETTDYMPNNANTVKSQNNGLQRVQEFVSQIQDNSIYNTEKASQVFRTVAGNIPTIELQVNENGATLNSLNANGEVVYSQELSGRPYRGEKIKQIINSAVYNADLSNINTAQTSQNGFTGVSNSNTTNYIPQNENTVVEENKSTSNLSDEEVRNIVRYNPDGREISDSNYVDFLVERYKDNRNIFGIVTDTRYVKSIENKSKKDKISDLYEKIKDKEFKVTKKLKDENGTLQNVNMDLAITKTGLNESFNKGFSNEKYAVVPYLDELIKTAPDGTVRSETKQRENILEWYYLYNTAEINGELYGVKIDIKKTGQGDRFYVHRVNLIKKEGSSNLMRTPLEMEKSLNALPSVNNSITQPSKNVKNNTTVNNNSMQNNENNTQNDQKAIQKELHNRIANALLSKNSKGRTYLGDVSTKIANKIKSLFGFEVSDRRHVLADNDIRHMIKEHGNPEIEKTKGQIAITRKDIEKIPDIISNYDRIVTGNDNREGKTIRYIKNYSDNISYVVEVIPEKGNALKIKTMWKKPVRVTNSQKTPSSTSKTKSGLGVSTSNKSIPQTSQNVKDNGIRAEKTSTTIEYDSQGNKLSKAQREFFKDSKVRDGNGNLLTLYHGTDKNFYEFKNKPPQHGRAIIDGYYLTTDRNVASEYGNNIMEVYVDLKNPLYLHNNNGLTRELIDRGYANSTSELIEKYKLETDNSGVIPTSKALTKLVKKLGFDGIITTTLDSNNIDTSYEYTQIVALKSNQIKNITNQNPTSNPDIRYERTSNTTSQPYDARRYEKNNDFMTYLKENNYLKTLFEVDENQGETYAHSPERLMEQEIRKLEETNGFDNSIPVTKLSDIDTEIEKYLGKTIGKGHFRERARGIYNQKTDNISVKEYKDLDNVFHELGHALDLGGRIKVDKSTLSDELIAASKRHGGYENESIGVNFDEGFAEILKTYAINKEIVRQDYPKSFKVLEDFKNNDQSFGKFISKLQQNTYNYIHQSPTNRVLSNQSIGEQTDKTSITVNTVKENVVKIVWDSNYSIKEMVNEFSKISGNKPTASQNAYLLTRLASGIDNKVISMLTNGYVDLNGKRLMPGLNKIGEILGNNPQRINDLRAYLVAKRDLEYKAKSLKTGVRTMDSRAVIEKFYNDTQIQEAAQIVYDTLDGVLQYAVDNNILTEDTAKALRESNAFYVPFQRVIEGKGNNKGRRGAVADIVTKRTGSELDIKDVLENIVANSANIIQQVENNNILNSIYEQGEETGMKNNIFKEIPAPLKKAGTAQLKTWETELRRQGVDTSSLDLEKTIDIFVPNNRIITEHDGSHIVSFFDKDGNRKYLQFYESSTDIFNSLMGLDKNGNSMFLRIMRAANMPLRYGATMANVGFAIPNMISDTMQATIYSDAGFIPVLDNIIGVLDVLGTTNKTVKNFLNQVAPTYAERINKLYDIYQQTGASSSTRMSQYRKSQQEVMRDIYGTKNSEVLGIKESFKPLKRLMDILTYIPELSEQSTRLRVFERNYNAYKKKGVSETDARIQAAIESRDATQDFGRTGTLMREVNQLIPFSAARVGSAYTFAEKVKANPKRTAGRVALLLTFSMIIKALGYDDDEIEELNQRKKDDNFVIKIGNTVFTFKKPQGILRSIINLGEYIQDLATGHIEEGKEGDRLVEWVTNTIMDNMPADSIAGLVPNAIAPVVENAINKDFYYNTDIVKSYDLDLPEEQQYYEYTSQLAIWLGQVFNYSPAKIDNLISGYLGGLGTQTTNTIDWISGKLGFSVEEPAMGAEDNAIGKRFIVNVNENSASVDEIYDRKDELTKKLNGGTITAEEEKELEEIKAGISKISAVNKQIKAIKQDLTMSGEEKAEQIRPLQEQKVDVARQALGKDPIYTNNTDNLDALEFYPTRSTLSYNGYTLEMDEDMKQEYEDLAYNLYKKYESQGLYSEEYLDKIKSKCRETAKKQMIQKYRSKLTK